MPRILLSEIKNKMLIEMNNLSLFKLNVGGKWTEIKNNILHSVLCMFYVMHAFNFNIHTEI